MIKEEIISNLDRIIERCLDSNTSTELRLLAERVLKAKDPEWGNCKRGCPPAYLDSRGYCSPACKLGFPKGK